GGASLGIGCPHVSADLLNGVTVCESYLMFREAKKTNYRHTHTGHRFGYQLPNLYQRLDISTGRRLWRKWVENHNSSRHFHSRARSDQNCTEARRQEQHST